VDSFIQKTLLAVVISIGLFASSCSIRVPCQSIATVTYAGTVLRNPIIEYFAGGKRYTVTAPRQKHLVKGEKFKMVYDSLRPYRIELLNEQPLFVPDEKTMVANGEICRCLSGPYSKVHFTYTVNGKSYKKMQVVEGCFYAKRKQACSVWYWAEDPRRAILVINESFTQK